MAVVDDVVDILSWLDEEEPVRPALNAQVSAHTNTLTAHETSGTSFEIQREVLLSLLEKVITVVPTRDMVPVYMNFQFIVREDELIVVGTSFRSSIVVRTSQVETKVAGTQVFPARTLLKIVKESGSGNKVFIEVTPSGAVIVSGGFSAEIKLPSGTGFPSMESIEDVVFHEVGKSKFLDAISTVRYALPGREFSGQESLKMVNIKGGKFTVCDGERFQQSRIDGFRLNMQLPSDSIALMVKILSSSDIEMLEIGELSKQLVFRLGNVVLYLNKLTDPYPNVEQLWLRPALTNDQELIVDRQELITAIKQVKTVADEDSNALGLVLDGESMRIVARAVNDSASATIACKWVGKPRNVVVNFHHLAEMLRAYPGKTCKFLLGTDTVNYKAPILLKDDETMAIATITQLLAYRSGLV
jgi:DNA polymerase III sliding clamp (beta) subunit (PCNA family)